MEKGSVIVDNTVLSNFALIEREDILAMLFKKTLFTTEEVLVELKRGEQSNVLPKMSGFLRMLSERVKGDNF